MLYHYYSMSCQGYTDAVIVMTAKKLGCWFNSGWSHLESSEENSHWCQCGVFVLKRIFLIRGLEEPQSYEQKADSEVSTLKKRVNIQCVLWCCDMLHTSKIQMRQYQPDKVPHTQEDKTNCQLWQLLLTLRVFCHWKKANDITFGTPYEKKMSLLESSSYPTFEDMYNLCDTNEM